MSENKAPQTEGLIYKGHPLRRVGNFIYYGTMSEKYIIMMQVLDTKSLAMAKLFALQNTTAKGRTVVMNHETGEVLYAVHGTGKNSFPKVYDFKDNPRLVIVG